MSSRNLLMSLPFFLFLGCPAELDEGREGGDCADGADNDADGYYDCNDPGCSGAPDCEPGGDDDDATDDDDGVDDDDATDDDDGANDPTITITLHDDPSLGATTSDGTGVFVYVMSPGETNEGFPTGKPDERLDGAWANGFEDTISLPAGSDVVFIAFLDVDGDTEVCTAGDYHGFAALTVSEESQTVSIAIVNVLDGTECERDDKPKG
jgi:hypothetical protein